MREAPTKRRESVADHRRFDWVMAVLSAWLIGGAFVDGWARASCSKRRKRSRSSVQKVSSSYSEQSCREAACLNRQRPRGCAEPGNAAAGARRGAAASAGQASQNGG